MFVELLASKIHQDLPTCPPETRNLLYSYLFFLTKQVLFVLYMFPDPEEASTLTKLKDELNSHLKHNY